MLKLNNKGFAISGILYATLILFLILMLGTLSILASGKFLLDKTKNDLVNKLNYEEFVEINLDYTVVKVTQNYAQIPNLLEGVTASDYYGNDLTDSIEYDTDFNITTPGTYQVTYTVSKGSNTVEAVRTIIVESQIAPTNFIYTGNVQTMNIAQSGTYKLEVWGAQGGNYDSNSVGGKGGYSVGEIKLSKTDVLNIYVGGAGTSTSAATVTGGYNGGGAGRYYGGSGGGATDIRIGGTTLYSRVIVAGGGGGANGRRSASYVGNGGAGGGTSGLDGTYTTATYNGKGGTQTTGGAAGTYSTTGTPAAGVFGTGGQAGYYSSSYGAGGGGGGWYGGGGGAARYGGGGGGSGFVFTSGSTIPGGYLLTSTYYLSNASTVAGNATMPNPDGGTMTGRSGNGYARVTPLILKY